MTNIKELNERFAIISEITKKYRDELTDFQGDLVERTNQCKKKDYVKFMNSLSEDVFIGNLMSTILIGVGYDDFKKILDGEMSMEHYLNLSKELMWWY